MLLSEDNIEVTGGSVGTQINATPYMGPGDWLGIPVSVPETPAVKSAMDIT